MPEDSEYRNKFNEAYEKLGGMGERVLGFCHCHLDKEQYPIGYAFDNEEGMGSVLVCLCFHIKARGGGGRGVNALF